MGRGTKKAKAADIGSRTSTGSRMVARAGLEYVSTRAVATGRWHIKKDPRKDDEGKTKEKEEGGKG